MRILLIEHQTELHQINYKNIQMSVQNHGINIYLLNYSNNGIKKILFRSFFISKRKVFSITNKMCL